MPHKITWIVPKQLMLIKIAGEINLQLMENINQDYFSYIEMGEAPIHLLVDAREITTIKFKISDIPSFLMGQDERFGANFIITKNRFARFVITMAEKLTGSHYRASDNSEDALRAFARFDPRLPSDLHEQAAFVDNF